DCGIGVGALALSSLLREESGAATTSEPLAARAPHFAPKAKRVIFLFMAGGPSQFELFDYKPKLQELSGQSAPESLVKNLRFAFISPNAKLLGTRRKFKRYGQSGALISDLLPGLASVADDVCFVKSVVTEAFNHG